LATCLELPEESVIRGRLVDIEGQAAADVEIAVRNIIEKMQGDKFSDRGVGYSGDTRATTWIPSVKSDAEGRFTVHGVPADCGVFLEIAGGDRFAPQDVALNTGMPEQRGERDGTYRPLVKNVATGEEALLALAPAQIFEGVVRFADTNEPAPHARVGIWASQANSGSWSSVAVPADAQGHYRVGAHPGDRFRISCYAPDRTPYLARQTPYEKSIEWQAGDRVKQVDLTLPRGVIVRGRVMEAGTNAPVAAASIQYLPERANNPNDTDDILTGWQAIQLSDANGNYEIVTLPGKGWIIAHGPTDKYILEEIGDRELSASKPGGERNYAHAFRHIEPERDQVPIELDVELRPGTTVVGTIVDEQGALLEEAIVISGLNCYPSSLTWRGSPHPILGGRFELSGLDVEQEYGVLFLDAKRKLGARLKLKASDEPPTVVLKPCGEATARFVDSDGEPIKNHLPLLELVLKPGAGKYDLDARKKGELAADSDSVGAIDQTNYQSGPKTDADGHIVFPALIPHALYWLSDVEKGNSVIRKEFSVASRQKLDLGEFVIERDKP
jgi:hypothetical protein